MTALPLLAALAACAPKPGDHGPVAEGISAPLGEIRPSATDAERATFAHGREVALHRFTVEEGLGPSFNITFCSSCHEKPTVGGSAGLYRNFLLAGTKTEDGAFFAGENDGNTSGVVRMYHYGDGPARPAVPDEINVVAHRNPIPFFGVGLIAEIAEADILDRADPDDADGDGVSGRPNYDRGFVGRFGMKAQTVSIEGFIRGPLFNHGGVTTDPLSDAQRAALPVDSSSGSVQASLRRLGESLLGLAQAAAPDGPLADDDAAPDPELSTADLFDLVSFSMLLAAPELEPRTPHLDEGAIAFDEVGCGACHTPRLDAPRGPIPVFSDLLLHDLGPEIADGVVMKEATGTEFRTAPLWGVAAEGPYLHDGRAATLGEAIGWHGGEAAGARERFLSLPPDRADALLDFLLSLGGRDQASAGLIPPGTPIAASGAWGAPLPGTDEARFLAGRELLDREFAYDEGVGSPRFNGDSCRACHFDPVPGGAGPADVNVMRHGIVTAEGAFAPPTIGTVLHKQTRLDTVALRPQPEANVFEHRQTPHLFGLGRIDQIPDAAILAHADPDDLDGDGISGRAAWTDGGRLGRFGWKAQVPSVAEFVRDAVTTELGMTLAYHAGLTYGRLQDNDDAPDPEYPPADEELLAWYLGHLAPPPRAVPDDPARAAQGEALFVSTGCAACHTPALDGPDGPVPLYSDLLLHAVLETPGVEELTADAWELRTPPLWGLRATAPYLHDGSVSTITAAIERHAGEAAGARDAFRGLDSDAREALLAFLETL